MHILKPRCKVVFPFVLLQRGDRRFFLFAVVELVEYARKFSYTKRIMLDCRLLCKSEIGLRWCYAKQSTEVVRDLEFLDAFLIGLY